MSKAAIKIWFFSFFVSLCSFAGSSGGGHGEINWWHLGSAYKDSPALGWLTLTFLIFVYAIVSVIKKPLSIYLETRSSDIQKQIDEGRRAKEEGEKMLRHYEEKIRTLDDEIAKLKSDFSKQATLEKAERERLAKESKERILRDTEDTIRASFERARNRLAHEVIEEAFKKAQTKIIESEKDAIDQHLKDSLIGDLKSGVGVN